MGNKSSQSAPVCSHTPDAIPIDSSVHQVLFKSGLPSFRWTTSSSATTTRDMTWCDWLVVQVASWWCDLPSEVFSLLQCPVIFAAHCPVRHCINSVVFPPFYTLLGAPQWWPGWFAVVHVCIPKKDLQRQFFLMLCVTSIYSIAIIIWHITVMSTLSAAC